MAIIRERIIQSILTDLRGITVAAGYNNTVRVVLRSDVEQPTVMPAIVLEEPEETFEGTNNQCIQSTMSCVLTVFLGPGSAKDKGAVASTWLQDLIDALCNTTSRRGELAIDTTMRSFSPLIGKMEDGSSLAEFEFDVTYLFRRDNPELIG